MYLSPGPILLFQGDDHIPRQTHTCSRVFSADSCLWEYKHKTALATDIYHTDILTCIRTRKKEDANAQIHKLN